MAIGSGESWQKKLKIRGLTLIGWTLPLMLFSLFASSLVSHVPPQSLLERSWGEKAVMNGRVTSPEKDAGEVNVMLLLEGTVPAPPKGTTVVLRFKSLDEGDDVKRSWKLAPKTAGGIWKAAFYTRIPSGKIAYLLRWKTDYPGLKDLKFQMISNPEKPSDKYFRMAEIAFYPMLALSLLGMVMVIFPHVVAR